MARAMNFSEKDLNNIRAAFEELDVDGSGGLDVSEVKFALAKLGKNVQDEDRFRVAFKKLDNDGSGFLEIGEFMQLLKWAGEDESGDVFLTDGADEAS